MINIKKEISNLNEHEILDFCEFWFGFKPHGYQKLLLLACIKENRIAALWSRQSGKSTTISAFVAYWVLTHPKCNILIFSKAQRQSSELFLKIKGMLEHSPIVREFIKQNTATQIMLKNGSRIVSLPACSQR